MKNPYKIVKYNNQKYIVGFTNKMEPFIIDYNTYIPDVSIYITKNGYPTMYYNKKHVYLHHFILNSTMDKNIYVDHINRIKTDNRIENLRLVSQSEQNMNQSKRNRNTILPDNCGINTNNIPTFIWYIKQNGTHGDRWAVEIKNKYLWKTTSSKTISTKCKFELAKKHLRNLLNTNQELFLGHSVNGSLSDMGSRLKLEYVDILKLLEIDFNVYQIIDYLQEDLTSLTNEEILLIKN